MSDQIFEGTTVEEALQKAAEELGVAVADLEHEAAGDTSGDFWGLGEPAVSVRAWVRVEDAVDEAETLPEPESPEEAAAGSAETTPEEATTAEPKPEEEDAADSAAATAPVPATKTSSFFAPAPARAPAAAPESEPEPAAPAESEPEAEPAVETAAGGEPAAAESAEASGEGETGPAEHGAPDVESGAAGEVPGEGSLEEASVALLNRIFSAMGFDCSAEARVDGEALLVAISGDDNQYLLDGRGRGLSALELILNHAFRHRAGDGHKKIHVDAGDFRARREDEIRDLAYQVSHQAKETGTEQETQPLNPYERRIVHLTLADDEQVTTRSRGAGFMKSVSIIPTTRGRG